MKTPPPSCPVSCLKGSLWLLAPIFDIQKSVRILRALSILSPGEIVSKVFEAHQVGEVEIVRCPREKAEWMAMEASRQGVFLHWKADKTEETQSGL